MTFPAFKGIVVGGGTMGAGTVEREGMYPTSHAGAIFANKQMELSAFCDPRSSPAAMTWGVPIIASLDQALATYNPDFAVVAVPEEHQFSILQGLLESNIKVVIAEKPLALTIDQAEEIVSSYRARGKKLIVNLSRRFSATYSDLAKSFSSQREIPISATIHYAKGIRHNGVHALDLVECLFGRILEWKHLYSRVDYDEMDPSVAVFMKTELCDQVFLSVLDEKVFTHFEVDIFTDTRRYTIDRDHRRFSICSIEHNVGIPPGPRLSLPTFYETDYCEALQNLMSNVVGVLCGLEPVICSGEDALNSLRLACNILDNVKDA